jgi:GTP-binding protein HflX
VLLSDTVGFIRDLPHNLVASFRSTLEEARHCDVLLHVVDASSPAAEQQIRTVNEVLEEIGIDGSQAILVLNKADAVADRSILDALRANHASAVSVSALEQSGFENLERLVAERLGNGFIELRLTTTAGDGRLFAFLARHGEVLHQEFTAEKAELHCRLPRRYQMELSRQFPEVQVASDFPAEPDRLSPARLETLEPVATALEPSPASPPSSQLIPAEEPGTDQGVEERDGVVAS